MYNDIDDNDNFKKQYLNNTHLMRLLQIPITLYAWPIERAI